MIEDRLQRAILFEQLPGKLRPDQRHARHVVDRIAHQRPENRPLARRDSPLGLQAVAVENFVLADVEELHAIGNQLPAILIAADEIALAAKLFGQPGDSGQNVIGLEKLAVQSRECPRRQ